MRVNELATVGSRTKKSEMEGGRKMKRKNRRKRGREKE